MKWQGLVAMAVILVGAVGCSDIDRAADYRELAEEVSEEAVTVWTPMSALADQVKSVSIDHSGQIAIVSRSADGIWTNGYEARLNSAELMYGIEAQLFPLRAYRKIEKDRNSDLFGFDGDVITLGVEELDGTVWDFMIGGPTPAKGGYYLYSGQDGLLYVVVPQIAQGLKAVVSGKKYTPGIDPKILQAVDDLSDLTEDEKTRNPWLAQVLNTEGIE